jgi:hypothetical protein
VTFVKDVLPHRLVVDTIPTHRISQSLIQYKNAVETSDSGETVGYSDDRPAAHETTQRLPERLLRFDIKCRRGLCRSLVRCRVVGWYMAGTATRPSKAGTHLRVAGEEARSQEP